MYSENDFRLYHHGILGMHWGQRNGPPYPLGASDHSASEKKAGWRKSLSKQGSTKNTKSAQNDEKSWENRRKKITPKDRSDYRKQMVSRYSKKNSKLADFYKNATDQQIDIDIEQKQRIKKALIATAVVAGTAVAIGVAYRTGALQKVVSATRGIKPMGDATPEGLSMLADAAKKAPSAPLDPETLKKAVAEAKGLSADDIGVVLDKNTVLHRMVAYEDFDVNKLKGATFVSYKDTDVAAYKAFLKDFSGTGKRFDVELGINDTIVAPTKEKTKQIIKELFNADTKDSMKLKYQLAQDYIEFTMPRADAKSKARAIKNIYNNMANNGNELYESKLFDTAIWDIVREGRTSNKIQDAIKKAGYNAIIDFHDVGQVADTPIALLNAANDVSYLGQTRVNRSDQKKAIKFMSEHLDDVVPGLKNTVVMAEADPEFLMQMLKIGGIK